MKYSAEEFKQIVCNYMIKNAINVNRANLSQLIIRSINDYESKRKEEFEDILKNPGEVETIVAVNNGSAYYISLPAEQNGTYHTYVSGTCSVFTMHKTHEEILTILSEAACIEKLNSKKEKI